jgi:predicted nuclease of predicted toxin-antitoxin system
MPLKVTLDEDLPRQAAQLLREHGYDAASVIELGMGGWKDPQLWVAIQKDERFLVTADKGFGDIRVYPPGTHFGILLFTPRRRRDSSCVEVVVTGFEFLQFGRPCWSDHSSHSKGDQIEESIKCLLPNTI